MKIRIVSTTEYGKIDKVIKIKDTTLECELKKLYECSSTGNILYLNETYIEFDDGSCFKIMIAPQKGYRTKQFLQNTNIFNVIRKFFRGK